MPKVSIIIPTRNRSKFLEEAVRSVLAQTYRDFEIIIIDDASTDTTSDIISQKFASDIKSRRIKYIRNEKQMERGFSRNIGVDISRGEYIALLDDDDMWLPFHLEILVNFLDTNKSVNLVFSNFINYSLEGALEKAWSDKNDLKTGLGVYYRTRFIYSGFGCTPSSLFRREAFERLGGFRNDIFFHEDFEFFSRVAMNYNVGYVDKLTCLRRIHQRAYKYKKLKREISYHIEKALKVIEDNSYKYNFPIPRTTFSQWYLMLGSFFIPHDFAQSRRYILKAINLNYKSLFRGGTWGLIFRVIIGQKIYLILTRFKNRLSSKVT
jgi:glycosyltransferase involved in cell wall biosynthesis